MPPPAMRNGDVLPLVRAMMSSDYECRGTLERRDAGRQERRSKRVAATKNPPEANRRVHRFDALFFGGAGQQNYLVSCPRISPALFVAVCTFTYHLPASISAACASVSVAEPSNESLMSLPIG